MTATTRSIAALAATGLVAAAAFAAVDAIAPTTGSIGTEITIDGSGFGATKPGAYLESTADAKRWPLKVTSFGDAQVRATIVKAALGTFKVGVLPHGASAPFLSAQNFQVAAPDAQTLDSASGAAGSHVVVHGIHFGGKKGKVLLGGKKGKVVRWLDDLIEFLVPKSAAVGAADIVVSNKLGTDPDPVQGFTVLQSLSGKEHLGGTFNGEGVAALGRTINLLRFSPIANTGFHVVGVKVAVHGTTVSNYNIDVQCYFDPTTAVYPVTLTGSNARIIYTKSVGSPSGGTGAAYHEDPTNQTFTVVVHGFDGQRGAGSFSGRLIDQNTSNTIECRGDFLGELTQ